MADYVYKIQKSVWLFWKLIIELPYIIPFKMVIKLNLVITVTRLIQLHIKLSSVNRKYMYQ